MAENTMTINGRALSVIKLLGKGKGGYSYLVTDVERRYVLKQIHHEPCDYYQFGDKLAAERSFENWGIKYWSKTPELLACLADRA